MAGIATSSFWNEQWRFWLHKLYLHCGLHSQITALFSYSSVHLVNREAEFLDVIRKKVLRVFFLAIHSHLSTVLTDFTPTAP
jgi:hypothetical protein